MPHRIAGANYIPCTMSEHPVHGYEVRAQREAGGKCDLNEWNPEYWERFSALLEGCRKRDFILQTEVCATHDLFTREMWDLSPWNPRNNQNYAFGSAILEPEAPPRGNTCHPFFHTVPEERNDTVILAYQQKFGDRILSHTLRYPSVVYCITNEIQHAQSKHWSWYWATDLKEPQHRLSAEHPEIFDFFEASQNSARGGQENWDNLKYIRSLFREDPHPINSVKIYGKTGAVTWPGTDEEAVDRFWRNILGGCASSRFHRNEKGKYGLGWSHLSVLSLDAPA